MRREVLGMVHDVRFETYKATYSPELWSDAHISLSLNPSGPLVIEPAATHG